MSTGFWDFRIAISPAVSILASMNFLKSSRYSVTLLLCALFTPTLRAQEAKAPANSHHTLWKIQGKQATVYLLGSVHALQDKDYPLPSIIENAFTNSRVVAFETDIGELESPALAMKMLSKSQLPEGQTLENVLSPQVYKTFMKHVDDSGTPAIMVERMKPAMAAITLEVFELIKMGLNPQNGVDKHFYPLAQSAGKEIIPLETVEYQLELVTGFSKEEGELLMKSTLKEIDNVKKEFGELVKAWREGDADKLQKLMNEAMADSPAIYKRLLTDRNHNWIPKIKELVRGDKNAIIIVGAGHLVGKEGVVELLQQDGLKVTQE
jgi:uncharacterized protein YbaP (TraB family)